MRRLRWSALLLIATLCCVGLTQTQPPAAQQPSADQTVEKSQPHPDTQFDPGIRLNPTGPCGSIVSYNFSQGEAPRLESVTTCTPSNTVVPRRARGKDTKPERPQLQKTGFSPDNK
jgi:hypothetical protein